MNTDSKEKILQDSSRTMVQISELETDRLTLRQWVPSDYVPFAALNADPRVMAYYPEPLTELESNEFAQKIEFLLHERGWGGWAVELKAKHCFIGFVGLHKPNSDLPFTPCVEIGWRLSREYWGYGYAIEAAASALTFAFETLNLREVVSFTSLVNKRSQAVMQRLHMQDTGENFGHPNVLQGHLLREHVLYKITRAQWNQALLTIQSCQS